MTHYYRFSPMLGNLFLSMYNYLSISKITPVRCASVCSLPFFICLCMHTAFVCKFYVTNSTFHFLYSSLSLKSWKISTSTTKSSPSLICPLCRRILQVNYKKTPHIYKTLQLWQNLCLSHAFSLLLQILRFVIEWRPFYVMYFLPY